MGNEHYAIRTGYDHDWEGRERAFVALDVRYNNDYYYQERERWWFDELPADGVRSETNPAMRAKIEELMDQYFRC